MKNENEYLFTSQRLGFRTWEASDLARMTEINTNPEVMRFFPSIQNELQTQDFIHRMQVHFADKGFCYFAVDDLESKLLIGFIGLHAQTFEADFTPCIDIGWRLHPDFWNKGLATEGARACLKYAFTQLHLEKIVSMTPSINTNSEKVMVKIGMQRVKTFHHPLLAHAPHLQTCVLYALERDLFN